MQLASTWEALTKKILAINTSGKAKAEPRRRIASRLSLFKPCEKTFERFERVDSKPHIGQDLKKQISVNSVIMQTSLCFPINQREL